MYNMCRVGVYHIGFLDCLRSCEMHMRWEAASAMLLQYIKHVRYFVCLGCGVAKGNA